MQLRRGVVARWLSQHGVDHTVVASAFPEGGWPLDPPLSWPTRPPDPLDSDVSFSLELVDIWLGELGRPEVDARLLWAIAVRHGRVGRWLAERSVHADDVAVAFSGRCLEIAHG